ncbi:MAG TPA: glycoside hydrolase family 31 protein [Cytophagaceae bacterium]|jgi:alpha-glucosidase|nr:glycoside hydrolase family 31 protein [Cytophagaceae bacterium]
MESYMNVSQGVVAMQQFPDLILSSKREGNNFYFFCTETTLEVCVKSDKIIRFRFAPEGKFMRDFSYSTAPEYQEKIQLLDMVESEDQYIVITKYLECVITKKSAHISILDKNGMVICEDEKGYHWEDHKQYGGEIVFCSKKIQSGEHLFGLGDKPTDLNLRGKRMELWGKDTYGFLKTSDPLYKNIPFFIGLHHKTAYGIFFDNSFRSFYDFGFERKNVYSFWAHGGEMNYYFIYGPDPLQVVEGYTNLTGKPEMPPLWALGYHQCKWSYYPEKLVRSVCNEFRTRKIPCDSIYLDIDYMDGFRCFTWNKDYFPNPKKMVSDLAEDGFKTIVIIDPGIKVDKNYSVYKEALDKDYFCKRMDGTLMKGSVWPGACNFPDFTNPEVREWWAGLFKGLIEDVGVKGVWNDMNEPAVFEIETFPYDVRHDYDGDSCSHRKAHNVYGMQMARATYEGVKKFGAPSRPFVITRSGYSGVQRYSSVWTGDNIASWEHMWIANIQCQRLSISGISFCGSDIGGFIETPTGELYVRWIQMGAFHAFFRTHSSGDHGDQEPWSFGPEYEELARKFIELRYQFLPYMYTTFWQYVNNGTPMLRPITFLDFNDTETYFRQDEVGVGEQLLICPIMQAGVDGRWLYLPEGKWYYYWDDEQFHGGMEVWAEAPLDRIPLYVRAGAVLPHYPVMQYVGEFKLEELFLHIYYNNKPHTSTIYEDAGDGYGYQNGEFAVKTFNTGGSDTKFTVQQSSEGKFDPEYGYYEATIHGLPFEPEGCSMDGEKLDFEILDKERNLIKVNLKKAFKKLVIS